MDIKDNVKIKFRNEEGEYEDSEINYYLIGLLLCTLESTRKQLGHTSIKSTLRYAHNVHKTLEFEFVRDIIMNEAIGEKDRRIIIIQDVECSVGEK